MSAEERERALPVAVEGLGALSDRGRMRSVKGQSELGTRRRGPGSGTDSRIMVRGGSGWLGDKMQTLGPPHPLGAPDRAEEEAVRGVRKGLNKHHLHETPIPGLHLEKLSGLSGRNGEGLTCANGVLAEWPSGEWEERAQAG